MNPFGILSRAAIRRTGTAGIAAAALLILSAPAAQAVLLGVDSTLDRLVSIDTTTGAATLGPVTATGLVSLAGNSTGGLYAFNNTFFRRFGSVDPVTGVFSQITLFGAGSSVQGMAFDSADTLFGVENSADVLMTIDTTTGAQTTIGATGFSLVTGIAFDASDVLYGVDDATDQLITIDTTTGVGTAIGALGLVNASIQGLAFDAGGTLFGTDTFSDQLVTIDTTTGAATAVGPMTGTFHVSGLTFHEAVSVPEAGTAALLALGVAGLLTGRGRSPRG